MLPVVRPERNSGRTVAKRVVAPRVAAHSTMDCATPRVHRDLRDSAGSDSPDAAEREFPYCQRHGCRSWSRYAHLGADDDSIQWGHAVHPLPCGLGGAPRWVRREWGEQTSSPAYYAASLPRERPSPDPPDRLRQLVRDAVYARRLRALSPEARMVSEKPKRPHEPRARHRDDAQSL